MTPMTDPHATRPLFTIDRTLSVPLGVQLRGQIEYGIACGDLPRGTKLPSVRELAHDLGLAHVTVAQVFKDLLSRGLIVTQHGRGTFVADAPAVGRARDLGELHRLLARTLDEARRLGFTPGQLMGVLAGNLERPRGEGRSLRVVLVGIFVEASFDYARDLARLLPAGDRVEAVTLEDLERGLWRQDAASADLVVTFAHREAQVRALLPGVAVVPLGFIPSDATRTALAALDPRSRLCAVATFDEFLPTLRAGVARFAPHISQVQAVQLDHPELAALLRASDAVVYATGSERVRALLPSGTPATEYRHTPDPADVERTLLPLLDERRHPTIERSLP